MTERLHFHFSLSCIGEGSGHPLQCSCLENPWDRGAWWAAVYGISQSRTRLKRLSSNGNHNYLCHSDPSSRQNHITHFAMLCYAKSLQSCPTLCDPIDGSPLGSPVPGFLQAKTLEWAAISFSNA